MASLLADTFLQMKCFMCVVYCGSNIVVSPLNFNLSFISFAIIEHYPVLPVYGFMQSSFNNTILQDVVTTVLHHVIIDALIAKGIGFIKLIIV